MSKQDSLITQTEMLQEKAAGELNHVFENILPWTLASSSAKQMLREHTVDSEAVGQFLDSLYLFKITEVSVSDDRVEEALAKSIGKRHEALVSAAYQSGLALTTVVVGESAGMVTLYLGVSGINEGAKEIFKRQVQGIYPGKGIELHQEFGEAKILRKALSDKKNGGIVTGIPPVRLENERQTFDLTTVIRSMHGQPFVLMTVARPVPKEAAARQIIELMRVKDECHSLVNRTIMQSANSEVHQEEGQAIAKTEGGGGNSSLAKGLNASGAGTVGVNLSGSVSVMVGGGAGVPGVGWKMASATFTGTIGGTLAGTLTLGGSLTKTKGETDSTSVTYTESQSHGWSKSVGESLQIEQQNSLAMELELIADKLIKRLRKGLNSGIWEVFLTYATNSEVSSSILSGVLCGELLKADPDALPARNVMHSLEGGCPLYLPKRSSGNLLKDNPLVSHVSSEEAAMLLSPPLYSVPGFDIRAKPLLSLTDSGASLSGGSLGGISEHGREIEGSRFTVSSADLRKHVFVAGITGSGKTTTVKRLLANTDVPFLVLESAKREYRRLLADEHFKRRLRVYTVGDSNVAPFRHNPFVVLPNVSALTHIDHLKSIFNASFSLYGPMPHLLEQCLHNIYRQKGWNLTTGMHHDVPIKSIIDCRNHRYIYPTIRNLIIEINRVIEHAGYAGELKDNIRSAIVTRMESLAVGAKGFIFNTDDCADIEHLLNQQAVFELESLADDDDKAFFVGLILALISEYRQASARREDSSEHENGLRHVLVIEEAHRLLKNISTERTSELMGNPKGKAVETFCNIIAEMRSLGQGVIVAEQIPTKIAPDVIKNTNTKIVHRLVSADDQEAVGVSLGLSMADCHYLNQLMTGFALVHKEGMARPIEVCIHHNGGFDQFANDALIRKRWREFADEGDGLGKLKDEDLNDLLELHESDLLDDPLVHVVARRLLNSVFLSGKQLQEVLPFAVSVVRNSRRDDYLTDKTIVQALEYWFFKVLLSPLMDMGNGRDLSEEVRKDIRRFWNEQKEYDRERLIYRLDQWRGSSSVLRVREFAATAVACEVATSPDEGEISKMIERELLLPDEESINAIGEALRAKFL